VGQELLKEKDKEAQLTVIRLVEKNKTSK